LSKRSGAPPDASFRRRRRSASCCQASRRGQHRRAAPPRGDRPEPVLLWSKEFLEAGKKRLAGDTARAATSDEVKDLRREASALKEVVAELVLENRLLKKSTLGAGEDGA
jgi:hypothetical protein